MIKEFVDAFVQRKEKLERKYQAAHPESYKVIVRDVIELIYEADYDLSPDPKKIHCIDDGACQGVLLFIIAEDSHPPYDYWYVRVEYGSCSECDTFQAIVDYEGNEIPTEQQVRDYLTLALHIVQNIKEIG